MYTYIHLLTIVCAKALAPCCNSNKTVSEYPNKHAKCNGVLPIYIYDENQSFIQTNMTQTLLGVSIGIRISSSKVIISFCDCEAAICIAVFPS